jgi:hypothetical protein
VTAPFDLVAFDPGDEEHQAFVYDSFRRSTDVWPWSEMPRQRLMERLKRELAAPGTETRIATPHGMPGSFLGWYAVRAPATVVYAYSRYSARHQGVATAAMRQLGVANPLGIVFWTPAAARIASQRWPLAPFFDVREAHDAR